MPVDIVVESENKQTIFGWLDCVTEEKKLEHVRFPRYRILSRIVLSRVTNHMLVTLLPTSPQLDFNIDQAWCKTHSTNL